MKRLALPPVVTLSVATALLAGSFFVPAERWAVRMLMMAAGSVSIILGTLIVLTRIIHEFALARGK